MLNPNHVAALWADAQTVSDRDAYVSDWALSSIWGVETGADILAERLEYLGNIWDCAHMRVKDICKAAGLTQAALASRFCIPKRTVENWCSSSTASSRQCPDYVRLMMCECLMLLGA